MRNKLSFFGAMFLLLFVGKIGEVGNMGNLSWIKVFAPIIADWVVDLIAALDAHYMWGFKTWAYFKAKAIAKVVSKHAKNVKP